MGKMKNQFTQIHDIINALIDYTAYGEILSPNELEARSRSAVDAFLGEGWFDKMVFKETGAFE